MRIDPFGKADESSLLDEKTDHALDHFCFLRPLVDELRDRGRLQAGVGEAPFDHPRQFSLRAAETLRTARDVERVAGDGHDLFAGQVLQQEVDHRSVRAARQQLLHELALRDVERHPVLFKVPS